VAYPLPTPLRRLGHRIVSATAIGVGTILRVRTRERAAALTFDDGPHPADTPAMLEILERAGARGTFFMVGKSAQRHPEVVDRVAGGGHAIGNHTWDHPSFRLITRKYRRAQLRWTEEVIGSRLATPRLFRPPYGEQGLGGRWDALRLGYETVCWDAIAEDWRDDSPETMADRILARLEPGSIVLLHDTLYTTDDPRHGDRAAARETVRLLIERLGAGWRFVTVPELLTLGPPVRWHWFRRAKLDWQRRIV
jgi:peptidoglycan/xylan/chitin deacetylase (PgdA/CDA1 family)